MTFSHHLLTCLFWISYGSFQADAVPAIGPKALSNQSTLASSLTASSSIESMLHGHLLVERGNFKDCFTNCITSTKRVSETTASITHSTTRPVSSSTNLFRPDLCTRATVTIISTEISVTTKTHTVTERVIVPTRMEHERREVCLNYKSSTKAQSTTTTSTTRHKPTTGPDLVITRRFDERGEGIRCLTVGIIPATLGIKSTSTSTSATGTKKPSKTKSTTTATPTSTTTSLALIHSIHFDRRTITAIPGHPKLEDSPTHGQ